VENFLKQFTLVAALLLLLAGCSGSDSVSSIDGVPIAFEKTGQGDVTLVLVHGWCCDQSYWREQVPALSDSFTVVTLDLAGHGASGLGRTDYTMPAFGADVAAVVAALDLHNVYLIGHSMGGAVIVEAARLLPDRVIGMIGIDTLQEPVGLYTPEQIEGYAQAMQADFKVRLTAMVTSMFPATADTVLVRTVTSDMASAPPEVAISALKNYLLHDLRPTLNQLKVPLWCLNSNQYPINFQGWKFYQPGYTAVLMQDVGHFLFLESPTEFNAELVKLIGRMQQHGK
jgi:pimeloyl-ACP methyl ester carboxylesterase